MVPAYKASKTISKVIDTLPDFVQKVIVVDDSCPENTGKLVRETSWKRPVETLFNDRNMGVGGAFARGVELALQDRATRVIVKMDADGQMDPNLLMELISPILADSNDFVKGNRFSDLSDLEPMPKLRLLGNAGLGILAKFSTGYWDLIDSTNGYLAMSAKLASSLPWSKIHHGYFFESDLLFRISLRSARVSEIRMPAIYGQEKSSLSPFKSFMTFPWLHLRNYLKRIFYTYYLRTWNVASFELPLGFFLTAFGGVFGASLWRASSITGEPSTAGSIFLAGGAVILGIQLLLAFLNYDVSRSPRINN